MPPESGGICGIFDLTFVLELPPGWLRVQGFGFQGVKFRGLDFRVPGFRVSGCRVPDFMVPEIRVQVSGSWVSGFGGFHMTR